MDCRRKRAWNKVLTYALVVLSLFTQLITCATHKNAQVKDKITMTELLAENDEGTLLISTLDGALHAIAKSSGAIKWTLKDDPIINNPTDSSQPPVPQFFPNPQDGSLYRYNLGRGRDPLKKLPFTIPQLVANSPCRSSDGIFYLGKKIDSWVGVDSITGEKQLVLGVEGIDRKCPKPSRNTVYFGRTLYNIILYEASTGNKWNISFAEYATSAASSTIENYDLVHYTSTGQGSILTVDQRTGSLLWTLDLDSPLVAMYQLGPEGGLFTIPMTTVGSQTLDHFTEEFMHLTHKPSDNSDGVLIKKLSPTIYIGEFNSGVYAVPSLVDTHTAIISHRSKRLLLEGPQDSRGTMESQQQSKEPENEENTDVLLLGYYEIPENAKAELTKVTPNEVAEIQDHVVRLAITHETNDTLDHNKPSASNQQPTSQAVVIDGLTQIQQLNMSFMTSKEAVVWIGEVGRLVGSWVFSDTSTLLMTGLILGFIGILCILYKQAQNYARLTSELSSRRQWSRGSAGPGSSSVTAVAEEQEDGTITVGKINFDPQRLLGKGCDGTFVFRGIFDGRSVAVKRVLPDCFSIADREVDLLRESDQHPNVIRYFCTEQCRQFRYIALELCSATLEDLVLGKISTDISTMDILLQATSGLQHLHHLDIVHRDVKPHNVLLSIPTSKGPVRAMISDFGLCKRLETGRMSFSKRSGITGTEGWIAPEMMLNTSRPTCKVDIFSLGCVYYYMMTKGKHPFGSVLDRQSNIISGKFNLEDLNSERDINSTTLIERMLSGKPSERPPATAILKHPFFWNPEKILGFFQDVSDRVEKESVDSMVVMSLERGGVEVVRNDWRLHMHPVIAEDLRKFRDYKGRSVRDLLRALRNKRNHYRELPEEAKMVFGHIPEEFVTYWTERFPRLLVHAWYAMQCVKSEPIFGKYYDDLYNFGQESDSDFAPEDPDDEIDDNFLYETHAFAPNNPSGQDQNSIRQSFLDTLLQRGMVKNVNKSPEDSNPVWVLRKPQNTFEPNYKIPEVRNLDGPWRRPAEDITTIPQRKSTEEVGKRKKKVVNQVSKDGNTKGEVKILSRMESPGSKLSETLEGTGSKLPEILESTGSKLPEMFESPGSKLSETLESAYSKLPETSESRCSKLPDTSESPGSKLPETLEGTSSKLPEMLEGRGSKLPEMLESTCSKLPDNLESRSSVENIVGLDTFEISSSSDDKSPDKRRASSQLRFRSLPVPSTTPDKPANVPDKQIKIVTGSGKKKKKKNLDLGNAQQ